MLSVVIPVKDLHQVTAECIANLEKAAEGELDIIIVDNNSDRSYVDLFSKYRVIRNLHNVGFWPAMMQGLAASQSDYVLMMHNDVMIWDHKFDERIINEFILDNKLGAVGLFGGRGVDTEGGRGHPEGNMKGEKYGTSQIHHGHQLNDEHPAVVFDSLAICLNKRMLPAITPQTIPPHHWTDRMICLRLIAAGFHCLTVGIAFDHGGGFTATTPSMDTFSEDWCTSMGLELDGTWELTLYMYGKRMFQREMRDLIGPFSQLWVDKDFRYYAK